MATTTSGTFIVSPEKRRTLREEGRAPTASEIGCSDRREFRYLHEKWNDKITHWYPCAKRKSHDQEGVVFMFRILPALVTGESEHLSPFLPGREPDGTLHSSAIRRVGIIDNFGSVRPVSFIPSLPFVPDNQDYAPYSSPADNPYQLLRTALWEKGNRLKKEWIPLIMLPKEIDEYRTQANMKSTHRSEPFLPMPKQRFFAYALIYRGHNPATGKDFTFDRMPYGTLPEHGLQVVSFNNQVFKALQKQYRSTIESDGPERFAHPDPAAPEQGALNYVWNPKFPHPVNGEEGGDAIGYDATVSRYYYDTPRRKQEIPLKLSASFLEWYYQSWEPWSNILNGTYATDQVRLIARFFPELKGPCEMAWQNHPTLMAAWEEFFRDAPARFDFHDLIHRKYSEDWDTMEAEEETDRKTRHRESRLSNEPSYPSVPDEQEYDFADEVPENESPFGESFPVDSEPAPTAEQIIAGRNTAATTVPRSDWGGTGSRTPRNPARKPVGVKRMTQEDFNIPVESAGGDTGEEVGQF